MSDAPTTRILAIIDALHLTTTDAARALGVHRNTVNGWQRRARGETLHPRATGYAPASAEVLERAESLLAEWREKLSLV